LKSDERRKSVALWLDFEHALYHRVYLRSRSAGLGFESLVGDYLLLVAAVVVFILFLFALVLAGLLGLRLAWFGEHDLLGLLRHALLGHALLLLVLLGTWYELAAFAPREKRTEVAFRVDFRALLLGLLFGGGGGAGGFRLSGSIGLFLRFGRFGLWCHYRWLR